MDKLHVSTEIRCGSALEIITRIMAELWHEKEDSLRKYLEYKFENDRAVSREEIMSFSVEEYHAEGIMDGLDIAMDIITGVILPDYFRSDTDDASQEK